MNIIGTNLEFSSSLPKRDNDLYSLISTKIILCDIPRDNLEINVLHQKYQTINNEGSPYHFVVYSNGEVYHSRNRIYKSGFDIPSSNMLKNSFYILVAKDKGSAATTAQINSIAELVAMILIQDNLLVTDILSLTQILTGDDPFLKTIMSLVPIGVVRDDPFRTVGDGESVDFCKFVSNSKTKTIENISLYTGVPVSIITQMNPHIKYINNTEIQVGITIFLPSNKMSDYLKNLLIPSYGSIVHALLRSEMVTFKEKIDSYKEV